MTLTLNSAARDRAQAKLATLPVAVRVAAEKPKPQIVAQVRPNLDAVLLRFATLWPGCFTRPGYAPERVLKIGIHRDIVDRLPDVKPRVIASALHRYYRNPGYRLRLLVPGATRFDLDGLPAGVVAESEMPTPVTGRDQIAA